MKAQHLRPFCPRRNDPSIVKIRFVSPTAAATGQFMLQQKLEYADQPASAGAKLWVAVERHPENAKRRKLLRGAAETIMTYDGSLDAKPTYTDATVNVGTQVLLHEVGGKLVTAPA